ncbi:MAG TPA: sulfotransferase domain-containing protein [Balneolales bacterium]|nr:sulfotransferase domain-containing protein [Balneolales bacterium]
MLDNIFHCCVQKTGSQWIKAIFADKEIRKLTNLEMFTYQTTMPGGVDPRNLVDRTFDTPFPHKTIISPLYISYDNYINIPKPEKHRTIFIMRDPRDIVVSWYYSTKYSHALMGQIAEFRDRLNQLDLFEGLQFAITFLDNFGLFKALGSWSQSESDSKVLVVKYENLIGNNSDDTFSKIFNHCQIDMGKKELEKLIAEYSFKSMSKRDPGQEDKKSHLRKGISGDWKNNFPEELKTFFKEKTGNLLEIIGYEVTEDW